MVVFVATDPESFHVLALPRITSIAKVASWTKMAAIALTFTSIFQRSRKKKIERNRKFLLTFCRPVYNSVVKMSLKKGEELVFFFFFWWSRKILLTLEDKENRYGWTTGSYCHTPLKTSVPQDSWLLISHHVSHVATVTLTHPNIVWFRELMRNGPCLHSLHLISYKK